MSRADHARVPAWASRYVPTPTELRSPVILKRLVKVVRCAILLRAAEDHWATGGGDADRNMQRIERAAHRLDDALDMLAKTKRLLAQKGKTSR